MQQISNLPVYAGVIPNKVAQNDYDFANNIFGFLNYSGNVFVTNFNISINELNTLADEIDITAEEIVLNAQLVAEKTALVQSMTATLPAGTVSDSTVGETSTWSSVKIKSLLDDMTTIITSSDSSLDSFQEIVAYIKQNKTVLDTLAISNIAGLVSALSGKLGVNDTAVNANKLIGKNWNWSGQGGQPAWVWGGSDGENMYVYNPANFSVNYANSAGYAGSAGSANSVSAAVVGAAITGLGANAVGSYAFLGSYDADISFGTNVAGSSLIPISTDEQIRGSVSGTWRCMGNCKHRFGNSTPGTLFLRIA